MSHNGALRAAAPGLRSFVAKRMLQLDMRDLLPGMPALSHSLLDSLAEILVDKPAQQARVLAEAMFPSLCNTSQMQTNSAVPTCDSQPDLDLPNDVQMHHDSDKESVASAEESSSEHEAEAEEDNDECEAVFLKDTIQSQGLSQKKGEYCRYARPLLTYWQLLQGKPRGQAQRSLLCSRIQVLESQSQTYRQKCLPVAVAIRQSSLKAQFFVSQV